MSEPDSPLPLVGGGTTSPAPRPLAGLASIARLPARAMSGLIWIYQQAVSPALAALNPTCGCRFAPTCSHYARTALQTHGLFFGLFLTVRRLLKCGPWHPGGEDPVPPRHYSCVRTLALGGPPDGCNKSAPLPSA